MFGHPIQRSDVLARSGGLTSGRPAEPLGAARRKPSHGSLRRWAAPLALAAVFVLALVVVPRVAAPVGVVAVITALVYRLFSSTIRDTERLSGDYANKNLFAYWRPNRGGERVRPASPWELADRADQLEKAAERFRAAGDTKQAAAFAGQAEEIRRYIKRPA